MKLIIITNEEIFEEEGLVLNKLFDEGLETLHLRKPLAGQVEVSSLLEQVSEKYYERIVLHDHFDLLKSCSLKGVHLNRRNSIRPSFKVASVSRSCHTIECLNESMGTYDYMFLSPIFNSISKSGYKSAFTKEQLLEAKSKNIINDKVIALGGVTLETVSLVAEYGFEGVAVLGAIWGDFLHSKDENALLKRFHELLKITSVL